MAKKYYAVQRGHTPGIYERWADCEAQVKGFSGAVYKSFPTLAEAKAFLGGPSDNSNNVPKAEVRMTLAEALELMEPSKTPGVNTSGAHMTGNRVGTTGVQSNMVRTKTATGDAELADIPETDMVAYIDGSYDKHRGAVGSGGVIFFQGTSWDFSFGTKDPFYTNYWNVSGELLGAMHVLKEAKRCGAHTVHLYYDYMGIEMWALGRWKTNNPLTQSYAKFVKEYLPIMNIQFHKVAAHTGVTYNERADQLAKAGTTKC
ncbi:ribonuclease H family protein [uncultured Veillonella sp.]|uniref:ribonuclease H family protein n=1 Tax=uncultured Veillonella sp. TaxID=159268 RepID=UPI00260A1149|nr:ribonuclease H family protein [uncultured Veillonella sp.]